MACGPRGHESNMVCNGFSFHILDGQHAIDILKKYTQSYHDRFKAQNEARFIINTDCQEVLQKLKNPIEIGPLKDICGWCNFCFYNGAKAIMKAEIHQI